MSTMSKAKARSAFLTWVAIWPLITLLLAVGEPVLAGLPLPLRTLVLTAVIVPLMSYAIMPGLIRLTGMVDAGQGQGVR